ADPENQAAISSLDRLFTMTERWSELVQILTREAEIGQSPDEILEFKYRLGQVHQSRLNDLTSAIAACRAGPPPPPDPQLTREPRKGLSAAGGQQMVMAEILEPLYQASGDWEKL